ncbi:MAG TPA: hypothetical protein VE594_01805 [Nitrososphaeraceae archaeon]|nr:hypothetical protein [Nitrososphaeraceae archaeon]
MTSIQTFAVEEIWEDYKKMGEMVKDIRNGDKDDDKVDYNKFKNSTVYKDANEDVRNCIDLANRVGEKLGDYEIVHCFENTNYFKEKYVDDEAQNTQDANRQEAETQNMTQSKSASDADLSEEEQKRKQEEQPTSNTLTSKDVRGNNLINELINTGKFTEDEAKEFVSQNMLNNANVTSTPDDTSTNDTKSISSDNQRETQEQREDEQVDQNQTKPQLTANTTKALTSESDSNSTEGCDSSYPEICITTYSAKLTCADIPFRNFKVLLPDPHGFDSDGDGIGCEE